MAISRGPKIVTNGLVLALDASDNNSFAAIDLPIKYGLVMWMDAADDSTFSYSSGTTVSQWRDKSGFNYHMVPVSAGPTRNSSLNSRKTLLVTSAQQIGNLAINLQTSANTVFVVSRLTGGANGRVLTAYYNNWLLGHWGGYVNEYFAEGWIAYAVNAADTTWRIYMGDWGGSSNDTANAFSNGTSIRNASAGDAAAGPMGLGINYQGYEQSNAEVSEVIVFNRLLSDTERKQVHTYLGQKWNISNTDRSVVDLGGNNIGSFGGAAGSQNVANMPDYDFYNRGAFKFNGTSDFIQYPSLLNLGNVFTINFWIKPTSNTRQTIISNGYPYLANKGFFLVCPGNSSTDIFLSLGNDQKQVQSNTGAITTGVVQMVTAVANGVGGLMKLYVNGIEVSYAVQQNADISLQYDSGIFVTGKRDTNSTDYLSSNLYALGIYNRALTATEVLQNYNAQKSKYTDTIVQQGLVLNLDAGNIYSYAGAGAVWYDVSGNSFNATLINSPTYTSDNGGVLNWASASSQYATVPMSSTLRVASITEEVWVYLSGTADQVFIGSQYGTSSNNSFGLWLQSGTFYFGVNTGGTFYYTSSSSASAGTWYHLIHTYNGTTQYLYINGVLVTTNNSAASGNISYDTSNTLLAIGADFNGTGYNVGPSIYTNGKMPVVRIYNIALSAAQVLQNYNATKSRFGL